jgi:hypothetical protein
MDPDLRDALTPILDDLRRTGGYKFALEERNNEVWLLEPDRTGIGITYDPDCDATANAHRIAERVQEYAMEASRSAWPTCPEHPNTHPLWLRDGAYTCPQSGTAHGRLGQLE